MFLYERESLLTNFKQKVTFKAENLTNYFWFDSK